MKKQLINFAFEAADMTLLVLGGVLILEALYQMGAIV